MRDRPYRRATNERQSDPDSHCDADGHVHAVSDPVIVRTRSESDTLGYHADGYVHAVSDPVIVRTRSESDTLGCDDLAPRSRKDLEPKQVD